MLFFKKKNRDHFLKLYSYLCSHQWTEVATNQHQEAIVRSLLAARDAFLEIRRHMREMGIAAGVPVRPPL